jgi:hypothetical protein
MNKLNHIKRFNESNSNEDIIYASLDKAIEETPSEDYEDVFDWMQVIFSQVEDELEGQLPEEEIEDLRMNYDEYVMSQF